MLDIYIFRTNHEVLSVKEIFKDETVCKFCFGFKLHFRLAYETVKSKIDNVCAFPLK